MENMFKTVFVNLKSWTYIVKLRARKLKRKNDIKSVGFKSNVRQKYRKEILTEILTALKK